MADKIDPMLSLRLYLASKGIPDAVADPLLEAMGASVDLIGDVLTSMVEANRAAAVASYASAVRDLLAADDVHHGSALEAASIAGVILAQLAEDFTPDPVPAGVDA